MLKISGLNHSVTGAIIFIEVERLTGTNEIFLTFFVSSPEQSSRRAIVLPPASALAFALASRPRMLKFLGPHYFQTL